MLLNTLRDRADTSVSHPSVDIAFLIGVRSIAEFRILAPDLPCPLAKQCFMHISVLPRLSNF